MAVKQKDRFNLSLIEEEMGKKKPIRKARSISDLSVVAS